MVRSITYLRWISYTGNYNVIHLTLIYWLASNSRHISRSRHLHHLFFISIQSKRWCLIWREGFEPLGGWVFRNEELTVKKCSTLAKPGFCEIKSRHLHFPLSQHHFNNMKEESQPNRQLIVAWTDLVRPETIQYQLILGLRSISILLSSIII